jgi:hypothetical protein
MEDIEGFFLKDFIEGYNLDPDKVMKRVKEVGTAKEIEPICVLCSRSKCKTDIMTTKYTEDLPRLYMCNFVTIPRKSVHEYI